MKRVSMLILIMFLLTACSVDVTESTADTDKVNEQYLGKIVDTHGDSINVYRFIDAEYNHICYVTTGLRKGGISCVPLVGVPI